MLSILQSMQKLWMRILYLNKYTDLIVVDKYLLKISTENQICFVASQYSAI